MQTLYIGNKNYSSWSLRPWLLMTELGIEFEEKQVQVTGQGRSTIHEPYSPNGLVPCLHDGDIIVWDTLAICEYLYESFPQVWPTDRAERAMARAVSAEMHSGFSAVRQAMPMNIKLELCGRVLSDAETADVSRIGNIWSRADPQDPRGPYLFGAFSAADAMFAPVAWRFHTYNVPLTGRAAQYQASMLALPGMRTWRDAAMAETMVIQADDALAESFGGPRRQH
jgi:glutathione S-transferase